ncbi:PulJ/GspJ family protein [Acetobacterium paludosum]|nr:type II secretion system protein [Acetobacterium paludosum]
MKEMQKKIKKNSGFTLIELIVALLITSILLVSAGSVYFIATKVYTRGENISYKEGTITNTETNLQEVLPVATAAALADAPKEDAGKSYSIGFKADGTCEEVIMSLVVNTNGDPVLDSLGRKQFSKIINTIPQISDIDVVAVQKTYVDANGKTVYIDAYTLNYELVPVDTTMSILKGGVVMNNIKVNNNNVPNVTNASGKNLFNSVSLNNNGGATKQYLVVTLGN